MMLKPWPRPGYVPDKNLSSVCRGVVRFNKTIERALFFLNIINPIIAQSVHILGCLTNDPYVIGMNLSLKMIGYKRRVKIATIRVEVFVVTDMRRH